MQPIDWIGRYLGSALDAVGAALLEVPRRLNHSAHRIAITGLQRSGKTVFATSFAHALLTASEAPREDFPFFPWREGIRDIALLDIPGIAAFPFDKCLGDLRANPPAWPQPTLGLTAMRIRIRHEPAGVLARTLGATATLDLDLVDYPGEWLLDLPMLGQSFREWSRHTEDLAQAGGRAALAGAWLQRARALDPDAPEDTAELARIAALYRAYLRDCRDRLHLYYLQPGRFLVEGDAPAFFPLSAIGRARSGSNAAALIARYAAYRKLVRRFYGIVFGRLRKQVVLVDLLTALQQGHESFADLALAIRTVSEAFEAERSPLLKMLPIATVDRLAMVATKADHVTSDQLNNLVGLLRDMIGSPLLVESVRHAGLMAVAAVRATTEVRLKHEGVSLPFLRGTPQGRDGVVIDVRPGVIPGAIPQPAAWSEHEFNIRSFAPPRLASPLERPLPNINLDKVLQFLIA